MPEMHVSNECTHDNHSRCTGRTAGGRVCVCVCHDEKAVDLDLIEDPDDFKPLAPPDEDTTGGDTKSGSDDD